MNVLRGQCHGHEAAPSCLYYPDKPLSLTYWGLVLMFEPYARHRVYISGDWRMVAADDIPQGHIICVMHVAPLLSNVAPKSNQVK